MSDLTTVYARRAVEGDRDGLTWVIQHFTPFVESQVRFRLGGRGTAQDIEDLTGEIWLTVLKRLKDLEPREGRLAPVLVSFLGTTALYACNNHLRRLAHAVAQQEPDRAGESPNGLDEMAQTTKGILTRLGERELVQKIRGCLDRMSDLRREVLVLRLLEQLSNSEIAESLGVPANTVAVRYRRALEELRSIMPSSVFPRNLG